VSAWWKGEKVQLLDSKAWLGLLCSGLVACASAQKPAPAPQDFAQSGRLQSLLAERQGETVPVNYVIAGGDKLNIRVQQMPELSGEFRVSEDGQVTLSLLGPVELAGLSEPKASEQLAQLLTEFLKDPKVTVSVTEIHGSQVAIMGAVARPGAYPIRGFNQTIADVITQAGGLTKEAGPAIYFSPAGKSADVGERREAAAELGLAATAPGLFAGAQHSLTIDLMPLYQGRNVPDLLMPVRPGDMIVVSSAGEVFVEGWVNNPGALKLARGMSFSQAIANAGGLHVAAASHNVTLHRKAVEGDVRSYGVDYDAIASGTTPDIRLESGDRIEVASNPVKAAPWGVFNFMKTVFTFGVGGDVGTVGAK
jgi:polysaccharide export outer membrane protein